MKNFRLMMISVLAVSLATSAHANWMEDIWRSELRMEGLQGSILDKDGQMLNIQRDMLSSQRSIENLMKDVQHGIVGNSGWGTYQFHDYQSYGDGAGNWESVLHMAENGSGGGYLGQSINSVAREFPIDSNAYNQGIIDSNSRRYYALKSQTILAARAASQLDYNKIQDQIAYQQMLQQQIEKTNDLKAAVDLNNRIQVEGNLINLEILRQVSLSNQQQAINEQANVNTALSNARFLIKK